MSCIKDNAWTDFSRCCALRVAVFSSALFLLLGWAPGWERACAQETTPPFHKGEGRAEFKTRHDREGASVGVTPDKALEMSRKYINKGQYGTALEILEPFTSDPLQYPKITSDYIAVLVWMGKYEKAVRYFNGLPDSFPKRPYLLDLVAEAKEAWIRSLSPRERRDYLLGLEKAGRHGKRQAEEERVLVLAISGHFQQAVKAFESTGMSPEKLSDRVLGWIAWSYFKTGQSDKSLEYFRLLRGRDKDSLRAGTGIAYCLGAQGNTEKALSLLEDLSEKYRRNPEVLFARAYVYEQAGLFWEAIAEYDRILTFQPGNQAARRLRILALSDLGANSYAMEQLGPGLPEAGEPLEPDLKKRFAVDRLHWQEPRQGLEVLEILAQKYDRIDVKFDLLVAQVEAQEMPAAIDTYVDLLKQDRRPVPWWVHQSAGKAYLYLGKPEKALGCYRQALEENPDSFESRMGEFYSLQELRRWEEARKVLDALDRDTPPLRILPGYKGRAQTPRPNWPALNIAVAGGWFELYQDRLKEGQEIFEELYSKAPGNAGIRNGLAHSYLWRGWPRKALREFQIIDSLASPEFYKHEIGRIRALNKLAEKERARSEARKLLAGHPNDLHVQRLVRDLEIEDMFEWDTEVWFAAESDGPEERGIRSSLSKRVRPHLRLSSFVLWQETEDDDLQTFWRRGGLEADWIVNSTLAFRQQVSVNYSSGEDLGSLSEIRVTPNDYFSFRGTYDTFSIDVPPRARVFDTEADRAAMEFMFRESDWRSLTLRLNRFDFSDGNERESGSLELDQGVYARGDWMVRCYAGLSASMNSLDDAPYFNPESDWALYVTPMVQQTVYADRERSFVHRIFLSLGLYRQSGYSAEGVGGMRYEWEYRFIDTAALRGGATWNRNVYDGESVNSFSMYLGLNWRF